MENIRIRGNFQSCESSVHKSISLFKNVTQMSLAPEILWNQIRLPGISNPTPLGVYSLQYVFKSSRPYNHLFLLCLLHTVLIQKFTLFQFFHKYQPRIISGKTGSCLQWTHDGLVSSFKLNVQMRPCAQMPFSFSSHTSFLPTCPGHRALPLCSRSSWLPPSPVSQKHKLPPLQRCYVCYPCFGTLIDTKCLISVTTKRKMNISCLSCIDPAKLLR